MELLSQFQEKKLASICKRGPYQWQALIRRKGFETQAKVFNTKAEAEVWAKATESEMFRGVFVSRKETESTTLSEALDRYLKEVIGKKKEPTRNPAESKISNFTLWQNVSFPPSREKTSLSIGTNDFKTVCPKRRSGVSLSFCHISLKCPGKNG